MAVFEPTEAEKAANSYLDWDDEAVGKLAKYLALVLAENRGDAEGLKRISAASCAMTLVSNALDANATELKVKINGFTRKGEALGDWTLTLERDGRRDR